MARGRPRKGKGTGKWSGGAEKPPPPPQGIANPAAAFERLIKKVTNPPRLTLAGQKGQATPRKKLGEMTEEEKFLFKREAFTKNAPRVVRNVDKQFDLLLNLSNRETYKYSAKEGKRLVARCRAWVDAVEESFQRRNPFRPIDLPPITFESTEAVALEWMFSRPDDDADVPPPKGLEDVWG